MGRKWFKLFLICLLCVGVLVSFFDFKVLADEDGGGGEGGDPGEVDPPAGGFPDGGSAPRPTDSIGITLAPEPTGTDGYKQLWHCKYHECTPDTWEGSYLCSEEAQGVQVGQCFSEMIPETSNIRDYCDYNPENWDSYNCFGDEELCGTFCAQWEEEDPGDDYEVVYCKPGCRTCEVCRNPDGSLCSLMDCRTRFYALCNWFYDQPDYWCDKFYCPSRCGYLDTDCLKQCNTTCIRDFALTQIASIRDLYNRTYTCLPMEKGKTMCAYMCDPYNLGAAPGCEGYESPDPVPPGEVDYWYCDGTDGCVGRNDFLPSECMTECGESGCQYDQACLDAKVFETEAECQAMCICENRCACSEETCEDDICIDECENTCLGTKECNLQLAEPPGLEIGNGRGVLVTKDDEGRNNICESDFWLGETNIRMANFDFTIDNNRGANYIDAIGLALSNADGEDLIVSVVNLGNGSGLQFVSGDESDKVTVVTTTTAGTLPEYETERSLSVNITFGDDYGSDALDVVWVSALDINGSTLPWTYTGRQFKVWDCEVPVSGAMYDGSGQEAECEANFVDKAGDIFDSLDWRNIDTDVTFPMVVNAPDYESSGNSLDWGFSYSPVFGNLDGDSESVVLKVTDVGGTVTCGSFLLNTTEAIDPYSTLPSAIVDFALVVNSDPWFQAENGGVQAGGNFSNLIPVTCVNDENCQSVTAIGGLIAAGGDMDKGCTDCSFADPDTWVNTNMVTGNLAYQYFYNEYFVKLGQGTTLANNAKMSDLGLSPTGIYFVDGDFWVDTDNVLTTGEDDYLIIIAKGRIVFEEDAVVSSGIFIADGDIEANDADDEALTIEGMLFSTNGNIELGRDRTARSANNTTPGVLVRYRPDYLFKLPGEITKVLSGWRER